MYAEQTLYYSNQCEHCREFLQEHGENREWRYVNVDTRFRDGHFDYVWIMPGNQKLPLPPSVQAVPALVAQHGNSVQTYHGAQLWALMAAARGTAAERDNQAPVTGAGPAPAARAHGKKLTNINDTLGGIAGAGADDAPNARRAQRERASANALEQALAARAQLDQELQARMQRTPPDAAMGLR